jgi:hypothetical protein
MEIGTDSALAVSSRKTTNNLDQAVEDRNSSELYVCTHKFSLCFTENAVRLSYNGKTVDAAWRIEM